MVFIVRRLPPISRPDSAQRVRDEHLALGIDMNRRAFLKTAASHLAWAAKRAASRVAEDDLWMRAG